MWQLLDKPAWWARQHCRLTIWKYDWLKKELQIADSPNSDQMARSKWLLWSWVMEHFPDEMGCHCWWSKEITLDTGTWPLDDKHLLSMRQTKCTANNSHIVSVVRTLTHPGNQLSQLVFTNQRIFEPCKFVIQTISWLHYICNCLGSTGSGGGATKEKSTQRK